MPVRILSTTTPAITSKFDKAVQENRDQ